MSTVNTWIDMLHLKACYSVNVIDMSNGKISWLTSTHVLKQELWKDKGRTWPQDLEACYSVNVIDMSDGKISCLTPTRVLKQEL